MVEGLSIILVEDVGGNVGGLRTGHCDRERRWGLLSEDEERGEGMSYYGIGKEGYIGE